MLVNEAGMKGGSEGEISKIGLKVKSESVDQAVTQVDNI